MIPETEIVFFRRTPTGRVHVKRERRPCPFDPEGFIGQFVLSREVARCGRSMLTVDAYQRGFIGSFPDDEICPSCVAKTPENERVLLFEHPIEASA